MRVRTIFAVAALAVAAVIGGAGTAAAAAEPISPVEGATANFHGLDRLPADIAGHLCATAKNVIDVLNPSPGDFCIAL